MDRRLLSAGSVLAALVLWGCASAKIITGPDGTENQLISCGGVEYCYEKAREVCGGNYKIVNTSSRTSGDGLSTSTQINLLVKCER
ncbi:MAG TPA: hypothetical protein PL182_10780 [Pseudobdellovibrionaceae bacterium]|nr:hypothetical protein [Pseudobdellovibrionaceae bacterium]